MNIQFIFKILQQLIVIVVRHYVGYGLLVNKAYIITAVNTVIHKVFF